MWLYIWILKFRKLVRVEVVVFSMVFLVVYCKLNNSGSIKRWQNKTSALQIKSLELKITGTKICQFENPWISRNIYNDYLRLIGYLWNSCLKQKISIQQITCSSGWLEASMSKCIDKAVQCRSILFLRIVENKTRTFRTNPKHLLSKCRQKAIL